MSLRLHRKYGVNSSMVNCYYCNEPSEIILVGDHTTEFKKAGLASPDGEMNMTIGVMDGRPCSKCEGYMKQGVILISVRDDQEAEIVDATLEKRLPNPYRTGGWVVVKEEALRRVISPPELLESVLKKRMAFIPDKAWQMLGLPRKEEG